MAWICFRDMAEPASLSLDSSKPSPIVRLSPEHSAFYCDECKRVRLQRLLSGTTCAHCKQSISELQSTSSRPDLHAKTSVRLEIARAWMAKRAAYSGKLPVSLGIYDQSSSSWRTTQTSWLRDMGLSESLGGLPRRGLMLNGECFPLSMWARRISERDSGHLLPTPTVSEYGSNQSPSEGAKSRPSLQQMIRNGLLPTPKASDGEKGGPNAKFGRGNFHLPAIACRLSSMLPTPTKMDCSDRKYQKQKNGSNSETLPGAAHRLSSVLPTPLSRDWKDGLNPGDAGRNSPSVAVAVAKAGHQGFLNPQFVAWMMGLPENALEPFGESQFPPAETDGSSRARVKRSKDSRDLEA